MPGGISAANLSLTDLLLIREIQNQPSVGVQALTSLGQGVLQGIQERREEAKAKKKQEEGLAKILGGNTGSNTNSGNLSAEALAERNIKRVQKLDINTGKFTDVLQTLSSSEQRTIEKTKLESAKLERENLRIETLDRYARGAIDAVEANTISPDITGADLVSAQQEAIQLGTKILQTKQTPISSQPEVVGDVAINRASDTAGKNVISSQTLTDPVTGTKTTIKNIGATGEEKGVIKWSDEAAQRMIKANVVDPKLNFFMDVGGRAYKELKEVAKKELGVDLDFTKGGTNFYKNLLVKKGLGVAKLTPLMTALDNLRPELGTELMRQLGAFRSATMAQKFEDTLAQFDGNIKEDIANMTTTIAKNAANTELLDDDGNILPNSVRDQKMRSVEANLIRKYNFAYRGMGLMDKPYTAGRDFQWLGENSTFSDRENAMIDEAVKDNEGHSRTNIIAKLIEEGLL